MDEQSVLHHLVEVEKNAERIVEDAQKAAQARIAEAGREMRLLYETAFRAGYAKLEEDYNKAVAQEDAAYEAELSAVKTELEQKKPNQAAFNSIAREFFAATEA